MDIESSLDNFHKMGLGFASEVVKTSLVDLESRKRKILLDWEKEAILKSRALWLLCGDDNTPFFHKCKSYEIYKFYLEDCRCSG